MRIADIIPAAELVRLARHYHELAGAPVFVLDSKKDVVARFPRDALTQGFDTRAVHVKEALVGYAAVPSGSGVSAGVIDFIAANFALLAEKAYETESLAAEVARNYEDLTLLWDLSSKLGPGLDLEKICRVLVEEVMEICPSTNVSVMLASEAGGVEGERPFLIPKVSVGEDSNAASTAIFHLDKGLLGYVFETKEPLTVCDVKSDSRFEGFPYPVGRVLIVPLVVEGSITGMVVATDKLDGNEYYSPEIRLLSSVAQECAVSIKKALLYDEIRTMLFKTAEAFSFAIDAKDAYTYGHSKRVSRIAVELASELGVEREDLDWLRLAALLHDIGKIGVPDSILNKAGKLDAEAIEKMKDHPVVGARMLERIERYREMAGWIRHHHEHFDGTGYPDGLRGKAIPLFSRVIAVADMFDALTSDRSYRKAMSREDALAVLRGESARYLDPRILDSLEKISGKL